MFGSRNPAGCLALVLFGALSSWALAPPTGPPSSSLTLEEATQRLEALVRETREAQRKEGLPVNVASWTYVPGVREVLRVSDPVLTYLFTDQIESSYIHWLKNDVGVEMRVLDTRRVDDDLYALVHCARRVRLLTKAPPPKKSQFVPFVPLLDDEELEGFDTYDEAVKDAEQWAKLDDPLDDWEDSWLLNGGRHRRSLELEVSARHVFGKTEKVVWDELDALAKLVRRSRTSGTFDLPKRLTDLKAAVHTPYPAHRRALRLSFAVEAVLDTVDRADDRQRLLECTSTTQRLAFAADRLVDERKALADALQAEANKKQAAKDLSSN